MTTFVPESVSSTAATHWRCPARGYELISPSTGEVRAVNCKTWDCAMHRRMLQWQWHERMKRARFTLFWTFTRVPEDLRQAQRAWHALRRWLYRNGVTAYVRATEWSPGLGLKHWHVMTAGKAFISRRGLDKYLPSIGLGSVNHVRSIDDEKAAAGYLLKYVSKSFGTDYRKRIRRLTCSRNLPAWEQLREVLFDKNDDSGMWTLVLKGGATDARRISEFETGLDERSEGNGRSGRTEMVEFSGWRSLLVGGTAVRDDGCQSRSGEPRDGPSRAGDG